MICGTARERAHRCVLAAQSAFCRASLAHDARRETAEAEAVVELAACGGSLRLSRCLREIVRYAYTLDGVELEALLDACYEVDARAAKGCKSLTFEGFLSQGSGSPLWFHKLIRLGPR